VPASSTKDGMSVDFMQKDKFETAAKCINPYYLEKASTPDTIIVSCLLNDRKGSGFMKK
jgi:hypothetical protein